MIKPYYEKDNFKLYLGNCLEILKEIQEKVDMIFA
ncbi:MAG TPA: site-specific DNA-methyltransferase, partial [Methanomicrobia archaeon]|nr:site-specific DNA-methyltransferase [Methanomicrobia archaeon]